MDHHALKWLPSDRRDQLGGGTIMDLAGLGNAMTLLGSTLLPMNTIHESVTFSISCRTFENPL